MAERRQQSAAHLVGLGERIGLPGRRGEVVVLEGGGQLRNDDLEHASARGVELSAVQLERGAWRARLAAAHRDRRQTAFGGGVAVARDDGSVGGDEPDARQPERLARPADERGHRALAAHDRPRHGREQLGLRCRAPRDAGPPRRLVDDVAHHDRRGDIEEERDGMGHAVDRDREDRLHEQEVEGQPRQHGREQGRPDAARQRDDDHEQLVGEDVRRDGVGRAQREQQPRQQGTPASATRKPRTRRLRVSAPPRSPRQGEPATRRLVRHDVHVDVRGLADDRRADARPGEGGGEASAPAHAEHELARVDGAREVHERAGRVVADDLVVAPAERLDQLALMRQRRGVRGAQSVVARHVHGEQLSARRTRGDLRAPADERLPLRAARQSDDHAFARGPGALDPVLGAVEVERAVDLVCEPQQREFAQRREVAEAEVVGEGRVDPLGRVDESRRQSIA